MGKKKNRKSKIKLVDFENISLREQRLEWFEARFEALLSRWRKILGLRDWFIGVDFIDNIDGDPQIQAKACVDTDLGHEALIVIQDASAFESFEEREKIVVHELTHVVMAEMTEYARHCMKKKQYKYWERLMETAVADLTRALQRAREE